MAEAQYDGGALPPPLPPSLPSMFRFTDKTEVTEEDEDDEHIYENQGDVKIPTPTRSMFRFTDNTNMSEEDDSNNSLNENQVEAPVPPATPSMFRFTDNNVGGRAVSTSPAHVIDSESDGTYENVPLPPPSTALPRSDPRQQQMSPVDGRQRHGASPSYNRKHSNENFGNNVHVNQSSYNDRVPYPHQPLYEAWLPAPPTGPNRPVTPTGKRSSLDETHTRTALGMVSPAVQPAQFIRQHRRGRSDEVSRCFEGTPAARHPTHYGSPPLMRSNYMMHLSRSTTSLDDERPSIGYVGGPGLHHSASVDSNQLVSNNDINGILYKQNTAYIKLQTSINLSSEKFKRLKKEVKKLEKELNKALTVQMNPTEKEHRQIEHEISILHHEITEMYGEGDKLGIPIDASESSQRPPPRTPTHPFHPSHPNTPSPGAHAVSPGAHATSPGSHTASQGPYTPSPTKSTPATRYGEQGFQYPGYPGGSKDLELPKYDTLHKDDNPPSYDKVMHKPFIPDIFRPDPPPRPPRPPQPQHQSRAENDNDNWACPSCTFVNLLVGECEVCNTPRPRGCLNAVRHQ